MSSRYDNSRVKGMLHARGRKIVNGDGEEIILRGWGAGNWTNPEGFMVGIGEKYMGSCMSPELALPGRFQSGRTMTTVIRETCGTKYAREFWPRWHAAHLAEADIREMARLGYNSIRLPLTAWVLLPEEPEAEFDEAGFEMLTRVLDACEKYRIYAILDLHGAPGGQSGLWCDDGLDNVPHMFLEPESRERALMLLEELARRYGQRWIVGGYDVLNEPISIPRWHHLTPELEAFYDEAVRRIRRHDKNHLLFLEGPVFATDTRMFKKNFDPECSNWALSVHMYSFRPEKRSLFKFLEVSRRLNVPVWIGEGKSNNIDMCGFYEIAAREGIGFNLWCWKTVAGAEAGAVKYDLPEGFQAILDYAMQGGARPTYAQSQALFDALIERLKFENCRGDAEVHRYCQRRQGVEIPGAAYDGGHRGESFYGENWEGNPLCFRTEDGMELVLRDGVEVQDGPMLPGSKPNTASPLEELLLALKEGEFACYSVHPVTEECPVEITARGKGRLRISCDGEERDIAISREDEFETIPAMTLSAGAEKTVKILGREGRVQIRSVAFRGREQG